MTVPEAEGFNQGVKIILSRMESNPEEFLLGGQVYRSIGTATDTHQKDRWRQFIDCLCKCVHGKEVDGAYLPYLTTPEITALHKKYMEIQRDSFTKCVMQIILEPEKEGVLPNTSSLYVNSGSSLVLGENVTASRKAQAASAFNEALDNGGQMELYGQAVATPLSEIGTVTTTAIGK